VLAFVNWEYPFVLTTDDAKTRIGAVLEQVPPEQKVIISKAEQNYSPTHLEGLAVVWAVKNFRHYLWGRHFTLQTDHTALLSLFRSTEPLTGRLARWQLLLME
jgi:putative transposase